MIDLPPLWQFVVLLATHYVGDFVLQTNWQASNKSRNNMALLEHVAVYTAVLAVVAVVLFGLTALWFSFVWINAVAHFCTDYVTSRQVARYFGRDWHNCFLVIGLDQLIQQATLATTLWLIVA